MHVRRHSGPFSNTLRRQWRVLLDLTREPQSVRALAKSHGVSKSTMQRDVEVLAEVFVVHTQAVNKQKRLYTAEIKEAA